MINLSNFFKFVLGDFIMLGNSVFRFNHPQEAEMLREMNQVY
jgi:hypothetical protein